MASLFGTGSSSQSLAVSEQFSRRADVGGAGAFNHDGRRDAVNQLIESEIIPRLLKSHPARLAAKRGSRDCVIESAEAERFASLPVTLEAHELLAEVEVFIDRGVPLDVIFVDLLAPSARKLGEFWEQDLCDFVEVTMGLWRLQEVMRELALRTPVLTDRTGIARTALFSPMPGEQHSFGALMLDEVFAQAGWHSEVLIEPQRRELLQIVADRSFDLVGLTLSCDCPSATLAELIAAIRGVSKHPGTQIFIGGRVVNANPDLVARVGADGTAPDAREALALANRRVTSAPRHEIPSI